MVKLWQQQASLAPLKYLPSLVKEYSFWMKGEEQLHRPGEALNHVVIMPDGSIMNRYFDFGTTPRPESYREDLLLSQSSDRKPEVLYSEMRSAAESGWDFSSRWLIVDTLLQTIQTTSIVPVDLNCLLWHLETTISEGFQLKGDEKMKQEFRQKARDRRKAIITFCYNPTDHYFFDYNFKSQKQSRHKTLAGAYPLFFKLVEPLVAEAVGREIESEFLKPGGLVTTLIKSKQQWDAPNGWAPLQWMVYKGLRNYKMIALAKEIKKRWMTINKKVYQRTGRMVEKYNVIDTTLIAGGGEYPTQDGFGWTNGVYLAMLRDTTSAN
jgi:alpha,alpha-trehalase